MSSPGVGAGLDEGLFISMTQEAAQDDSFDDQTSQ